MHWSREVPSIMTRSNWYDGHKIRRSGGSMKQKYWYNVNNMIMGISMKRSRNALLLHLSRAKRMDQINTVPNQKKRGYYMRE